MTRRRRPWTSEERLVAAVGSVARGVVGGRVRNVRPVPGHSRERNTGPSDVATTQLPIWTHDIFTAPTTYQLTSVPYGINVLADNGVALSEGTDYTIDYSTGLITFTAGRTAGHTIYVSYVTTGDLTVPSAPDTGNLLAETESTFETGVSSSWQVPPGVDTPITITQAAPAHTGSYSLQLATTSGGIDPLQATLMRDVPVTASASYDVSGWVNANRGVSPLLKLLVFNASGGLVDVQTAGGGSVSAGTWTEMSATISMVATADHVHLQVVHNNSGVAAAGDTANFDDLVLRLH